jgi:hypothetical protein
MNANSLKTLLFSIALFVVFIFYSCKKKEAVVGKINSIECAAVTNNGELFKLNAAVDVFSTLPYKAQGEGKFQGLSVASTGVTGLTATLEDGEYSGDGLFKINITGTPDATGIAEFNLDINGISCTLEREVLLATGTISSLNCASATKNGTLSFNTNVNGTLIIPYSGGNAGSFAAQVIQSTGVDGLTATLPSGAFNLGDGNLTFNITGLATNAGIANFAINIAGQSCTIDWLVNYPVGAIGALSCGTATNSGTLNYNSPASGVKSVIPYSGSNGGIHNGQTVTSTGVGGLTATLVADTFALGSGTLTYNITGTPLNAGVASFLLNIGGKTCTLTRNVVPPALGTTMQGGKLFYIFQPGDPGYSANQLHGFVAVPNDYTQDGFASFRWSYFGDGGEVGTDTSFGSGATNCNLMSSSFEQGLDLVVYNYNANTFGNNNSGYTDWFVPSFNELKILMQNQAYIGTALSTSGYYWSSSENEYNFNEALSLSSYSSTTAIYYLALAQTNELKVRLIRKF